MKLLLLILFIVYINYIQKKATPFDIIDKYDLALDIF